jgi:DNA primase
MSIPPRFLDELRDRLTLSEVIGRRVKLTRAGREFKACCPFHHEKSPSFYINDDKQFYHCFGCGAHGDVIGFLMQNDSLSFIEAVEALAAEAGMQVPQQSPQAVEQAKKEKSLHSLLDDTAKFFEAALREPRHRDALDYIQGRGVPEALMAAFRLGFAPEDGRALFRHLKDRGYETAQMVEAGVVRRSEKGGDPYSFFRDRVMFPVADRRGRVVAFGARVLPEHLRPQAYANGKPPKYINSSDTPLFHKGTMLYSEAHARQAAHDGGPVIVVEGYLDVMSCFGAGFPGAVAPLGTALTEEQILSLWKMIPGDEKTPILCFDGDDAGRRAAARACERLLPMLKPYHSARFVFLPQGQDPDSLIRAKGKNAFEAELAKAVPLVDVLWDHHWQGRRFDTPEAKAGLAAMLNNEIARIADRTVQRNYKRAIEEKIYNAFGKKKFTSGKVKKGFQDDKINLERDRTLLRRPVSAEEGQSKERVLFAILINHPHIFEAVGEAFARIELADRRLDLLRQAAMGAIEGNPSLDSTALQSHLKDQGFGDELNSVLSDAVYNHAGFARPNAPSEGILAGWHDAIRFMHDRTMTMEIHQARQALATDFTVENEQRIMSLHDARKTEQ